MVSFLDKLISRSFYALLFFVPLLLWPASSETFEFNKMVLVYVSTTIITAAWLTRCVLVKKFIFRRTVLDIPIVLFLASLGISTLFSIDPRTSLLGYYSRFHGGLLSYLCYALLYWAFVSNIRAENVKKFILVIIGSSLILSSIGALEHFGYFSVCAPLNLYQIKTEKDQVKLAEFSALASSQKVKVILRSNCWKQDIRNRVFSTMGQPNWLAAWIVALMPITWALALGERYKVKGKKFWILLSLSALFFTTLLFTKSRSGLLGFLVADLIFWSAAFLRVKKKALSSFIIHNSLFIILAIAIGTPFASNIPAPETGGTESGQIRKIVWRGAFDLWKKYPIFGTGPETFAYSYYETRPMEHNLVSEWNFIYNKAHNEYLNFAATTGSIGLGAYLILIGFSIYQILSPKYQASRSKQFRNSNFENYNLFENWSLKFGILAGYTSVLVTNFFGFSVVPVALLFFMFPAFAATTAVQSTEYKVQSSKLTRPQTLSLFFVLCTMLYVLYRIVVYWYSDFIYSKGKTYNQQGRLYNSFQNYLGARNFLVRAVELSAKEPVFWSELSQSSAGLAVLFNDAGEKDRSSELAEISLSETNKAISLSPRNLNLRRSQIALLTTLALLDPKYLSAEAEVIKEAIAFAPTDASLYYSSALTTSRLGETSKALDILNKTIDMKPNYRNARFARALILIGLGRKEEAKEELTYILEKIEPNDNLVRQELEKIN